MHEPTNPKVRPQLLGSKFLNSGDFYGLPRPGIALRAFQELGTLKATSSGAEVGCRLDLLLKSHGAAEGQRLSSTRWEDPSAIPAAAGVVSPLAGVPALHPFRLDSSLQYCRP